MQTRDLMKSSTQFVGHPIQMTSQTELFTYIDTKKSANSNVENQQSVPSSAASIVQTSFALCREKYGCENCKKSQQKKCNAFMSFHISDYYVRCANAKNWELSQAQTYVRYLNRQYLVSKEQQSPSSENDTCEFEKANELSIPKIFSTITTNCPPLEPKGSLQFNISLKQIPEIEFILLAKPLLSFVNLNEASENQADHSAIYDNHTLDPLLRDIFYNWHRKNPNHRHPLEEIFSPESCVATDASVYHPKLASMYKRARLLLHLTFLSGVDTHNANIHDPKYYFQKISSLKKKNIREGDRYYSDTEIKDAQKDKRPAFSLLGNFEIEEKWFYEMCTGLSLTAAIACALKEITLRHQQNHESSLSITKRLSAIYKILNTFKKDIISCPAVFWRITILCHIITQLDLHNTLLETPHDIERAFRSLWTNYGTQVAVYPPEPPQSEQNQSLAKHNSVIGIATQEFLDFFLQVQPVWGIDDEEDGSQNNADYALETLRFAKDTCAQAVVDLTSAFSHEEFPFSYTKKTCPHIDMFRSLWAGNALPRDLAGYFSKVHSILYPEGFTLPEIKLI